MLRGLFKMFLLNKLMGSRRARRGCGGMGCLGVIVVLVLLYLIIQYFGGSGGYTDF